MNKITFSCEIRSGPHGTQYYMENPKQDFVAYASSRTDEAKFKWYTFKPEQNNSCDTYNPSWKCHPNLSLELGKNESSFFQREVSAKMEDPRLFSLPCRLGDSKPINSLADLGSCVKIIPLFLFKKLNIRLLDETNHVFGLADGTKSYLIGIVQDVEVHIGKLKLLNDFYVIDMKKDLETPLLVGRGLLVTAIVVIDCRKANIVIGEGTTRNSIRQYDDFGQSLEGLKSFFRDIKVESKASSTQQVDVKPIDVEESKNCFTEMKNSKVTKMNSKGSNSVAASQVVTRINKCAVPTKKYDCSLVKTESKGLEESTANENDKTAGVAYIDLETENRLSSSALDILVPSYAVSKVMGRGQTNVDNIRKISGASVEISNNKSSRGHVTVISGKPEQKLLNCHNTWCTLFTSMIVEALLFLEMIQESRWRWNLLNLLMSLLSATLSASENVAEYFELLFKMIKTEDARLFLIVRGCHAVGKVIGRGRANVDNIRKVNKSSTGEASTTVASPKTKKIHKGINADGSSIIAAGSTLMLLD
nr:ATP-dependent helicase, C-terminal [Tanacetum cinerariifolium]